MLVRHAGLCFALALAANAQSIHELFGTDQFHRAYVEGPNGEVTFEPFQELNWEAKARTALPWLNLDRPAPAQIARLSTFESAGPQLRSIEFRAPLDPRVGRATYILISADAVTSIQAVQLKGYVNFNFNEGMSAVEHRALSGTIIAKPATVVATAAFAITGKASDVSDVRSAKFERESPSSAVYNFVDNNRAVTWTTQGQDRPAVASALSFRLTGRPFVLVKWKSEVCVSSYTLFSVGAELKPIASNDYDCDP